jgi:raffinose/stachyose/melibiose transport system substrate-binding protein
MVPNTFTFHREQSSRGFRLLTGVSVVALAGATLAGCASSGNPGADTGSVTLTMSMINTYQPGLDPLIEKFEAANEGITVQPAYYAADVYASTVPTQFAGGSGTDLMFLMADTGVMGTRTFQAAGYLADLSDQSWVDTIYPATSGGYEIDGAAYARDLGISALAVLSYNEKIFADLGLEVPTTFDDLLDQCATISAAGLVPISWGGASTPVNWNNVVSLAGNTLLGDDQGWLGDLLAGDTSFASTPGWTEALDQVTAMQAANCFSPGVAAQGLDQMLGEFAQGKSAMMFTYGGLNGVVLQQAPDLEIEMFSPPVDGSGDGWLTVQAAGGIGIWAKSAHLDAAKQFLAFLSEPDNLRVLASQNQLISPTDALTNTLPDLYAGLLPYFESGRTIAAIVADFPNATVMSEDAGSAIQGLFTGQLTVGGVLEAMDVSVATQ